MNRKHRHNDDIRPKIMAGGAALFREKGFEKTVIDDVMASAGLTRGAFYAHFASKTDLFVNVVGGDHPLIRKLCDRSGVEAGDLWVGMMEVFGDYLSPQSFEAVRKGCNMAMLQRDVARGANEVRQAYDANLKAILTEMAREQGARSDDPLFYAALTLAVGAIATAAATASKAHQTHILNAAWDGFQTLLTPLAPSV